MMDLEEIYRQHHQIRVKASADGQMLGKSRASGVFDRNKVFLENLHTPITVWSLMSEDTQTPHTPI